ncbi:MAG: 4-phosphopantetheinyl transferase family protein [Ferruginibacter sp.]|nr:4-phosphopantetheinyl transferase family protein [Ferruginibacter sp.]
MTGNDIVDIATAAVESNWQRKGFLQKVFTPQEQLYICSAPISEQMVWQLWSMKESAYKLYTRQYGGRFFAPQKLSCTLATETTGKVELGKCSYRTNTIVTKNYIYTTARPAEITHQGFINSCFILPELKDQRQFVYKKIIDCYCSTTGYVDKNLSILKDKNGIPFLNCGKIQIPVSITHHGHFAGFTIY